MLAPPGAGKGTQADRLSQRYHLDHIATGEILRQEVSAGTAIGEEAQAYIERGDLVPDELLIDMVAARVIDAVAATGYVLDGFPRTLGQAEAAYQMVADLDGVALQAVLHLEVGPDELRARLRARAATEDREDDTGRTVEHRLDVYRSQTEPLLEYYGSRGILHSLDGERSPDDVTDEIIGLLEELGLA